MTTRRNLLHLMGASAALAGLPRLAFAVPGGRASERRLVFVFLRGGMDGLSAVPPYGDPQYAVRRGPLAVPAPGVQGGALDLDGRFGLNPNLPEMHRLYAARQLAVLHAVASPYRERSHFDAQNLVENGTAKPFGRQTGWLNLALVARDPGGERTFSGIASGGTGPSDTRSSATGSSGALGFALGPSVPLVLRGPAQIGSWSPSKLPVPDADLLERLGALYRDDPLLGRSFAVAREAQAMMESRNPGGVDSATQPVVELARAAGEILGKPDGPRVATIDFGGWDTHISQLGEYSQLTRSLRQLDRAVATLEAALGPAWRHTAVLIVTEFGRAVAPNGSGGTDHGTAGAAFVAGGAVRGGRVIADWPGLGLEALHEARDLRPTLDLRAVFKAALAAQLGLGEAAIEMEIFPDSRSTKPLTDLFV
jgi:uncharacterized protein (DUF1501 family)